MEEIMTRIAEALERVEAIQTNSTSQVKQYQQLRADLAQDIKKALAERPTIQHQLNSKDFADHVIPALAGKLPNVNEMRAAGQEIVDGIGAYTRKIPTKVEMKGNFYGMASRNAFWSYIGALVGVMAVCTGICLYYRHQADQLTIKGVANEMTVERNYYRAQIDRYKVNNPKYATLFPPFDDTKLQEAINKLRSEQATTASSN